MNSNNSLQLENDNSISNLITPKQKANLKNENADFQKAIFIKNPTEYIGFNLDVNKDLMNQNNNSTYDIVTKLFLSEKLMKKRIEWMTISNTELKITNFITQCKIQLTCKSFLQARFSSFEPNVSGCPIEIFGNSHANFDYCYFHDSKKASIIIRDFSWAKFSNCIFENNSISCYVQNNSFVEFENCFFLNDNNASIFAAKNSQCYIKNCQFKGDNKAIFSKDDCRIKVEETEFNECYKGAIRITEKSILMIKKSVISDTNNTAIRATGNSVFKAQNLTITNTKGNAINFENSNGYFYKCQLINNTNYPTIAIKGRYSNPIFSECDILDNGTTFAVVIRNCSRPLFDNCLFTNCESNCFSISDFSMPLIKNCAFNNMSKCIFHIFGKSIVTLIGDYLNDKINISKNSQILNENERELERQYTVEQENTEDEEKVTYCKSWIPSSYKKVPKIEDFADPISLLPLPIVNVEKIIQNEEKNVSIKCCNHEKHSHEDQNELFISAPCGHCVCESCSCEKNCHCPVCDTPIKSTKKIFREEICTICKEKKATTILTSCGHMCMCYECTMKCFEQNFKCPICNQAILSFKYMFDD